MIAIILAGGKSRRLCRRKDGGEDKEKALVRIAEHGQGYRNRRRLRLLDIAVESVRASKAEDFFVAITKNTPMTDEYCKHANYKTIETPGEGYHEDLWCLLRDYPEFVSIACDIPFLGSEHINAIIDAYLSRTPRVSVTGAVSVDILPRNLTLTLMLTPGQGHTREFEYAGKRLLACGINAVTNSKDSRPLIFDDPLLALNINTRADLRLTRRMMHARVYKRYKRW